MTEASNSTVNPSPLGKIFGLIDDRFYLINEFNARKYTAAFERYKAEGSAIFAEVEAYGKEHSLSAEELAEEAAKTLMKSIMSNVNSLSDRKRSTQVDKYKYVIAVYFVPMVRVLELEMSEPFVLKFKEFWDAENLNNVFEIGDYDSIANGFRRSIFCYITTAVCEEQNKPDDCYELTMFRDFRDGYLKNEADGEALIEEYYETAPIIVAGINMKPNRADIYNDIWERHLSKCLQNLENHNHKECKDGYVAMVRELQKEYLSWM
ncbi:MAG: hypothetical protein K6G65_05515 [Lachnospiraceae bacterium]|nr:hypothetical protein [Lachnospiraceae bacterium]